MATERVLAYQRVKEALLAEIKSGAYSLDHPFITEREICGRFEVSRATAIRALSDLVHEGMLTRQRGRGSFVVPPLESVSPGRRPDEYTRLIGCIFHHLRGRHPMEIIRGIEHVCRAADYNLLLFDSEGSAHTEALNLARARNVGVHGVIAYPTEGFTNATYFQALQSDGLPFVLIDRYYPTLPTNVVVADNYTVGYQLTDVLLRQGHRYIATIWEEVACTSVQDRLAGYRQAHATHGVPIAPELAALRPYILLPATERRARLAAWLQSSYCPTAYLITNSECLELMATDLVEMGVRLRDEVTMVSMDDSNLNAVLSTCAASVTLPSSDIGSTAMRVLLEHLTGERRGPLRHIVLPAGVASQIAKTVA